MGTVGNVVLNYRDVAVESTKVQGVRFQDIVMQEIRHLAG
jgi:hypothetical protein